MPTLEENRIWESYDWTRKGDEWSAGWGSSVQMWHGSILPRIHPYLPAGHILEIAPGHGRCTQYLAPQCDRLSVVDLVPGCIEACKRRFSHLDGIEYHVNDGLTLPMIEDGSVDFAFSWDSLVHAEEDVMRSYALELGRTLKPGGFGFLHHSNFGSVAEKAWLPSRLKNEHWRGRTMTAKKFRAFCAEAGLFCLSQELIFWGCDKPIDAFSLLQRPFSPGPARFETDIQERPDFSLELKSLKRVGEMYAATRLARR